MTGEQHCSLTSTLLTFEEPPIPVSIGCCVALHNGQLDSQCLHPDMPLPFELEIWNENLTNLCLSQTCIQEISPHTLQILL